MNQNSQKLSSISIVVDTNAAEDAVFDHLLAVAREKRVHPSIAAKLRIERKRLDVGDVLIESKSESNAATSSDTPPSMLIRSIVCERKTWEDLRGSMLDGRFHEQKQRMLHGTDDDVTNTSKSTKYMYIIESVNPSFSQDDDAPPPPGVQNKCLWAALLRSQMRDGVHVHFTRTARDIADTAIYLAMQVAHNTLEFCMPVEIAPTVVAKRKRGNFETHEQILVGMLQVIPGVSYARAKTIVDFYDSVDALANVDETELAAIPCGTRKLGRKLARHQTCLLIPRTRYIIFVGHYCILQRFPHPLQLKKQLIGSSADLSCTCENERSSLPHLRHLIKLFSSFD